MMAKPSILLVIVAPLVLLSTTAGAQGVTGGTTSESDGVGGRDLSFEGSVAPACVMRQPNSVRQNNATVTVGTTGDVNVDLQSGFLDRTTGVPNAVDVAISFPITCNTAHSIHVESQRGGLVNPAVTGTDGPFRSRLDFTLELRWAGGTQTFDTTSARMMDVAIPNAATGSADVRIAIPGGGTPLVAGIYSDTIIIQIEATS